MKWLNRAIVALLAAVVLIASEAGTTQGGPPEGKIDPYLKLQIRGAIASLQSVDGDSIEVILRAREDISPTITALGGDVRTVLGDGALITADVPRSAVQTLAADPRVLRVGASVELTELSSAPITTQFTPQEPPELTESLDEIRVPEVWSQLVRGVPNKGKGVIVGMVDSGIDWNHGDFKNADGTSRILSVWDQTASGTGPAGTTYKYGVECSQANLNAKSCSIKDSVGHGTHTASTAAGNGLSTSPSKFVGVAPEADIIAVRYSSRGSSRAIDAWSYIIAKAQTLGRPVVINNSWGHNLGAKDGSDDLEAAIDLLAGSGKIFVNAAGNAGGSAVHAMGILPNSGNDRVSFTFKGPSPSPIAVQTIWYKGSDSISVSLTTPQGVTYGPVKKGAEAQYKTSDGIDIVIDATTAPYTNGDNLIAILLSAGSSPLSGNWSFSLKGDSVVSTGRFDAWLGTAANIGGSGTEQFTSHISEQITLGEPATAKRTITVANYISKRCFTSITRGGLCNTIYEAGAIAPSSSRGGTRDGRQKPDIAGPGTYITAALSPDSSEAKPTSPDYFYVDPDGKHITLQGTSMAAPHVAGVIALLLQRDPTLTPESARLALIGGAYVDRWTGSGWSGVWGWGKLDALNAAIKVPVTAASTSLVPALMLPQENSTLTSFGPSLEWVNPPTATQYHLQVIPYQNDGPGVDVHIGSAESKFLIPAPPSWYGLLPDMTYTWRVRTSDATTFVDLDHPSWTAWSTGKFRTPTVSGSTITQVAPLQGETITSRTPALRWSNSRTDVFYYDFQLSKDSTFNLDPATATAMVYAVTLHGGITSPLNSYAVPAGFPLEPNTTYYWRVRPHVQGDGKSATWSSNFVFSTSG